MGQRVSADVRIDRSLLQSPTEFPVDCSAMYLSFRLRTLVTRNAPVANGEQHQDRRELILYRAFLVTSNLLLSTHRRRRHCRSSSATKTELFGPSFSNPDFGCSLQPIISIPQRQPDNKTRANDVCIGKINDPYAKRSCAFRSNFASVDPKIDYHDGTIESFFS